MRQKVSEKTRVFIYSQFVYCYEIEVCVSVDTRPYTRSKNSLNLAVYVEKRMMKKVVHSNWQRVKFYSIASLHSKNRFMSQLKFAQ